MIRKQYITIVFWLCSTSLFPQAFTCDHTFYVVLEEQGKSILYNLWFDEADVLRSKSIPLSEPNRRYACLGLSIEDLHLYALDFYTKELLRINAGGVVTNLGVPENLDTSLDYWAGDVMPEGRRLVVVGNDPKTGVDRSVYSINLTVSNYYAGSSGVVSNYPTAITDLATDPIRGITYGYDRTNRQIVVIGTNSIAHHNHQPIEPILEALFFDEGGNLYAYGSGSSATEQTTLFAIDKIKGGATRIADRMTGNFSDGCSCPATLSFTRTVWPSQLLPCSDFYIDYYITNHSGIGKTGVVLEDLLPAEVSILEVGEHTFTLATIEEGVESNRLYIPNLDILIGENVIRLKARLNAAAAGSFYTQASLENLPLGLGGQLLSDDTFTATPFDPNITEVLRTEDIELEQYTRYSCNGDTVLLSLPFEALSYLWSDGSTAGTLSVTQPGLYWVEAGGSCAVIRDSILLSDFPEPSYLELGQEQQLQEGSVFELSAATNAAGPFHYQWQSAQPFDLSCTDCAAPQLIVSQDNTYYLELTDRYGCLLMDSLYIRMIPARNLYAPNAFSPNGDGINDIFYLQGRFVQARILEMAIWDRWGNRVFSAVADAPLNDANYGWNGKTGGRVAAAGVYLWLATIEFGDGEKIQLNGALNLLLP